jgi:imidazolonepropionase-like amidohydrolase
MGEGRILALESSGPVVGDAPYVDARRMTVLPGLVNAHVHIARGGMFGTTEPIDVFQIVRNLRSTLRAGVTSVGDMGCPLPLILSLREQVRRFPQAGPSLVCAGPLVTVPGGYPLDWLTGAVARLGVAAPCRSEIQGRATVAHLAAAGVNHIKLALMHRSYSDRRIPVMSVDTARAVVCEAHRLGLRVFAHAHTRQDQGVAIDARVDALMHSCFDTLDGDMIRRIRDQGVVVCPTLWVFEGILEGVRQHLYRDDRYRRGVSPRIQSEWERFYRAYTVAGDVLPAGIAGGLPKGRLQEATRTAAANLMLLKEAGVRIAFGNDAAYGMCVHHRPLDELLAMHRSGMSAAECLRSATSEAAALLGLSDRGLLEEGRRADLLVVNGDLERDLSALENVRQVFVAGRAVDEKEDGDLDRKTARAVWRGLTGTVGRVFKDWCGLR